ncbi:MAG: hypothetical protein KBA52_02840, partial [Candidatus Kapabacteria bacterium]|nr:hypothetical protein [Candidatus Kapabacteria bacterium]
FCILFSSFCLIELIILYKFTSFQRQGSEFHITVTCMKRWGVRASFLSPDTNADAGQTLCITTYTPMFYTRCCVS